MSYILDALKKSEQQRGHGSVPDVQTVHSSSLNYRNEKTSYWPYVLVVAVLLNLVAILYFIYDKDRAAVPGAAVEQKRQQHSEIIIPEQASTTAAEDMTEYPAAVTAKPANEKPRQDSGQLARQEVKTPDEEVSRDMSATVPATATEETSATSDEDDIKPVSDSVILSYYELPESIASQLPSIVVSAHVYSSNPLQRSIVINNNFMEEGEYVIDGLTLEEITMDGAIFNFNGTLFHYNVVSGWQ